MLSQSQMESFDRDGAIVVPGVLDGETLNAVRREYEARLGDIVSRADALGDFGGAEIPSDFCDRLVALLQSAPQHYAHLDISLPLLADMAAASEEWRRLFGDEWREEAGFFGGDSVFNLLTHPRILEIAAQILGDDNVAVSPVQHARIKPPQRLLGAAAAADSNVARTLWHQDEAVVTEAAVNTPILTVWTAITEATRENGCMYAVRGSHKAPVSDADFGLTRHCPGGAEAVGEIYIPDAAVDKSSLMPLEAEAGDVVLLHRRTVHGAGSNDSQGLRWSFDLRYQPAGTPTGRECFPAFSARDARKPGAAEDYRRRWREARDMIIAGEIAAVFNSRWDKYASLCA